jgi:hypothetical protein
LKAPVPGSSDLNFTAGETVANFTPLGMYQTTPQGLDVRNGFGSTNVILDIDGYYGPLVTGLVPPGPIVPVTTREPSAQETGPTVSSSPSVAST